MSNQELPAGTRVNVRGYINSCTVTEPVGLNVARNYTPIKFDSGLITTAPTSDVTPTTEPDS